MERIAQEEAQQMIPESHKDLLEEPVVVTLVTLMPDGAPQATPVWCDVADGRIRVNTARGRQKDRNLSRSDRVAIMALDPKNPYRWIEVRGRVVGSTEEGAEEHIDQLSHQYYGRPFRQNNPNTTGEVRVIYFIEPTKVNTGG